MATESNVARHYGTGGIAERILAALRGANGADAPVTVDALSVLDHFHGRGIVATKELVELLKPEPGEHLLDIGSGIGGPARWFAAKCGVRVTGIDLTPEFSPRPRRSTAPPGSPTGSRSRTAARSRYPLPTMNSTAPIRRT